VVGAVPAVIVGGLATLAVRRRLEQALSGALKLDRFPASTVTAV